jgi:Retrotransposon gag protein
MAENYFYLNPDGSRVQSPVPPAIATPSDVNELLLNLNARLQSLEARNVAAPVVSSGLSPKVSLPEKFGGSISRFRDFIISIENIFALQPARYATDQIKTRFTGTLLCNEALSWFRDVVQNKVYLLDDYSQFILDFTALFDDPNAKRHACTSLKRLRQGRGSVLAYSAKFRRLASETGYNEDALLDIFRFGLSEDIKDILSTSLNEPSGLDDFIKFGVRIDQRLYDRKLERGGYAPRSLQRKA